MKRASLSLRLKLTAVVIAVAVIPLGVIGFALINIKTNALREANRELLTAIVRDIANSIEATFDETEERLAAVGRALTDKTSTIEVRIAVATELVGSAQVLERVGLYDQSGALIDSIGEEGTADLALPSSLADEVRQAARDNRRAIAAPQLIAGAPRVLTVVPIKGEGATWYAATYASLRSVQGRVDQLAEERFAGDQASVFVVDGTLRAIAHADREQAEALAPMHAHGILADFDGGRLPTALSVFRTDARAGPKSMTAVLVSVDSLGWGVVAQMPTERAFRSLTAMRRLVIAVLIGVMLAAVGASILLAHRLTEPIRALVSFASDLAARRFDKRVTIHTRDELSLLGQALSSAAQNLEASEREIKEQVEIRSNLGRYLPSQLVDRIVKHEQSLDLGGERREITVLFADVAGFTPLAESHAAEEVVTILNELFTILTEIVFRHDGTVDKFIGDCVMAFWGAPNRQPDHASRALRAAEDMLRFLELGNRAWEEKYGVTIRLAIGVHTGDAVVGNFGSTTRMEYTAVGAVVNLAAHLEAIARPQQILVTAATKAAAGDDFEFLALGERELPGHRDPATLFEVRL